MDRLDPQGLRRRSFRAARLLGLLAAANVATWAWAAASFAGQPALLGMALVAWTFGLRHALDADHIAAIDNAVRRLVDDGRPALRVGAWFSLGHSTIVVIASALVGLAALGAGRLSVIARLGDTAGGLISAGLLVLLAAANVSTLARLWRRSRAPDRGAAPPVPGGLVGRLVRPALKLVSRDWHMYAVGLLFGLGFDTSSQVALLGLSASQSAHGLALAQMLAFPALFTTGMSLVDGADGALMEGAYGWALASPRRQRRYNLAVTGVAVAAALAIAAVELTGLAGSTFRLEGGVWTAAQGVASDLGGLGIALVAVFLGLWSLAAFAPRRAPAR